MQRASAIVRYPSARIAINSAGVGGGGGGRSSSSPAALVKRVRGIYNNAQPAIIGDVSILERNNVITPN